MHRPAPSPQACQAQPCMLRVWPNCMGTACGHPWPQHAWRGQLVRLGAVQHHSQSSVTYCQSTATGTTMPLRAGAVLYQWRTSACTQHTWAGLHQKFQQTSIQCQLPLYASWQCSAPRRKQPARRRALSCHQRSDGIEPSPVQSMQRSQDSSDTTEAAAAVQSSQHACSDAAATLMQQSPRSSIQIRQARSSDVEAVAELNSNVSTTSDHNKAPGCFELGRKGC